MHFASAKCTSSTVSPTASQLRMRPSAAAQHVGEGICRGNSLHRLCFELVFQFVAAVEALDSLGEPGIRLPVHAGVELVDFRICNLGQPYVEYANKVLCPLIVSVNREGMVPPCLFVFHDDVQLEQEFVRIPDLQRQLLPYFWQDAQSFWIEVAAGEESVAPAVENLH